MSDQHRSLEAAYAEHVSEHYRRASDVKLSKHHAFNAHEHLKEALLISEKIGEVDVPLSISIGMNDKPGLQ